MVAVASARAPARIGVDPIAPATVERLAVGLLLAVGLDLVLTRFLVRLAIFIPKDEPAAAIASLLGRVGAASDVLVPIMGGILLVAMLVRAGHARSRADQVLLTAVAVIGVAGVAYVVLPQPPLAVAALAALTAAIALTAGVRLGLARELPWAGRIGVLLLAVSVAVAGVVRALDAIAALAAPGGAWMVSGSTLATGIAGQAALVAGAGLIGLAGFVAGRESGEIRRGGLLGGLAVGMAILAAGSLVPVMWSTISTWSIGLSGAVPVPLVALAAGLAVAGLPVLHRRAPSLSVGAATVVLAGYGLAASGLVLAGLLGLVAASIDRPPSAPSDRARGAGTRSAADSRRS
jgi:hypothetical protein